MGIPEPRQRSALSDCLLIENSNPRTQIFQRLVPMFRDQVGLHNTSCGSGPLNKAAYLLVLNTVNGKQSVEPSRAPCAASGFSFTPFTLGLCLVVIFASRTRITTGCLSLTTPETASGTWGEPPSQSLPGGAPPVPRIPVTLKSSQQRALEKERLQSPHHDQAED